MSTLAMLLDKTGEIINHKQLVRADSFQFYRPRPHLPRRRDGTIEQWHNSSTSVPPDIK